MHIQNIKFHVLKVPWKESTTCLFSCWALISSLALMVTKSFEPRYKQMMNDCILDSKPFGYIAAEPEAGELNGWSQPARLGVLCTVSDYEESGSNLIIQIASESVFEIEEAIQPVLPNSMDTERYPGVEELMEEAGNPVDGKLYIRANVGILDPPKHDHSENDYREFIETFSSPVHSRDELHV